MKIKTMAVVLAAGRGKRMNSNIQKQYMELEGKPVLYYSLNAFQESFVDEIILVVSPGDETYCFEEIVEKYGFDKVSAIVPGGKERYHSVYNGLKAAEGRVNDDDIVFIHDGARPFITEEILGRAFDEAKNSGACVVGMPVKDTIKIVDDNEYAVDTPNRNYLWQIQTPQVFKYGLVKDCYGRMIEDEELLINKGVAITDDAMVVEQYSETKIKLVEGDYTNIKITTPEDISVAESYARQSAKK